MQKKKILVELEELRSTMMQSTTEQSSKPKQEVQEGIGMVGGNDAGSTHKEAAPRSDKQSLGECLMLAFRDRATIWNAMSCLTTAGKAKAAGKAKEVASSWISGTLLTIWSMPINSIWALVSAAIVPCTFLLGLLAPFVSPAYDAAQYYIFADADSNATVSSVQATAASTVLITAAAFVVFDAVLFDAMLVMLGMNMNSASARNCILPPFFKVVSCLTIAYLVGRVGSMVGRMLGAEAYANENAETGFCIGFGLVIAVPVGVVSLSCCRRRPCAWFLLAVLAVFGVVFLPTRSYLWLEAIADLTLK